MSAPQLTHRDLDALADAYRTGSHLFGSDEHDHYLDLTLTWMPQLIAIARTVVPGETLAVVHIPGFLPRGTMNSREHHMVRARRVKKEHETVALCLLASARDLRGQGRRVGRVVITRNTPRLFDSDNCVSSMKGVRDEIAKFLGVDDGDPRISWCVEQRKVPRAAQGTVIRIEASHEGWRNGETT